MKHIGEVEPDLIGEIDWQGEMKDNVVPMKYRIALLWFMIGRSFDILHEDERTVVRKSASLDESAQIERLVMMMSLHSARLSAMGRSPFERDTLNLIVRVVRELHPEAET